MEYFASADNGSPLDSIDVSFSGYVARRQRLEHRHMAGGIPDYAFALDYELREKLKNIPHFYSVSKKLCQTMAAREIQLINQKGVAVGPSQFPEIYHMGMDCARRLGIGAPNIFVVNEPDLNAYTIAADDVSPLIVLHSGIVWRMTEGELKCVIGHECGHIHNQHTVYKYVISKLLNSGGGRLGVLLSLANVALMQMWTRAQEITADRAALICADAAEDADNVQAKLMYGAAKDKNDKADLEALMEQLKATLDNPARIAEAFQDHPGSIRRIAANREFRECEILYSWRPEWKKPGMAMCSKEEADRRCKKIIAIVDNK